jgi:hypothetical protein
MNDTLKIMRLLITQLSPSRYSILHTSKYSPQTLTVYVHFLMYETIDH